MSVVQAARFRIPARYVRSLLMRGLVIWVVSRFMVMALYAAIAASTDAETAAAFTQGNPLILTGWTLALSLALVRLDIHRRHEIALLNNLGVFMTHAVAIGAVPTAIIEFTLAVAR